ncbi:MAG: sigma-70 family RNA polymerase sigma factor [Planctomycetota bacterium]
MGPQTSRHPQQATSAGPLQAKAAAAYTQQSRQVDEEQWIIDYLPLVRHVVQKVAANLPRHIEHDDLISAGTLGLVKAARRFDPSKKVEFKTYAYICIRGAVIDELRRRSFVPSNVHYQIRKVRQAYEQHVAAHGQPPSDESLAESVEMTPDQLYQVLEEGRRQNFMSIHGLTDESPTMEALTPPDDAPLPHEEAERRETLERLAQAITELPQRDRTLLLLYYERDLTMKEAAEVLGVTESRVSQLHASAVFRLSMKLRRSS